METLSERLAFALSRQDLNPPALAEKIGVTRQTIYNILNGTTKAEAIRAVTLYPLAAALGVRPEWLLLGKGPRDLKHSGVSTENKSQVESGTASHPATLDPDTLHESLTLLFHDEGQAGAYTPRAETARLIELYRRVELAGGRLTKEQNDLFEAEIAERMGKNGQAEQPAGWRAKRHR